MGTEMEETKGKEARPKPFLLEKKIGLKEY